MNTTANRIKELRKKAGLNQSQLAQQTGISEQSISKYERGQRNPKIENLEVLANFFKVPVSYLRGEAVVNRLKELRQQAGLSLAEVGKGVGLATNTISRYETGQREPKIEVWQKLADFFHVPISYLRGKSNPNRIKKMRQVKGVSQQDVAKALGLTRQAIALYETGQREPRLETWQKLANYFGVSVPSLMGLDEITTNKIYMFQGNILGSYNFAVLARSEKEAWGLIKDRIASNKNQFLDDEFANDIRKYSISSIDLNDAAPQVIEDWKR